MRECFFNDLSIQTFYILCNLSTSLTLFHLQMMSLKYMFWKKSETLYSSVCNGIRSVKRNFLCRHAYQKHTHLEGELSKTQHYTCHFQVALKFLLYVDLMIVQSETSMSNHASIYLILSFCKFPNPVNSHLWPSLLSFRNMSLVLPRT
jgi:hypothetical protein